MAIQAPDITVVIPAHHEGRMANHTLSSVIRAARHAEANSLGTEILVLMDRPDEKTRLFFESERARAIPREEVDFGDLGLTRNFGVQRARAPFVAFVDADNLIGENWLSEAYAHLARRPEDVVVHPEYVVTFEGAECIWRQISSDSSEFRPGDFIENNFWDATCVARTQLLSRFPYQTTMAARGFGYEDWHFNCETLAAGIAHHVIPGTVLFLRKKRTGSLLAQTIAHQRVVRPSTLFTPTLFRRMLQR